MIQSKMLLAMYFQVVWDVWVTYFKWTNINHSLTSNNFLAKERDNPNNYNDTGYKGNMSNT